ncbi:MAG: hypothetical protein ACLT2Z_02045 [Eubacterium sp.]
MMMVYIQIVDSVNQEKKDAMAGQISLFDLQTLRIRKIQNSNA